MGLTVQHVRISEEVSFDEFQSDPGVFESREKKQF